MAECLTGVPAPGVLVIVALGLVVESGLLVGVLVPGTALALTAGATAASGLVPLPAAVAATAVGTLAGGRLGHLLGRRRRGRPAPFAGPDRLLRHVPTGAGAAPLPRPSTTVAVGQWLSVGRVVVPRTAGWSGMGHVRFTLAHTPSATGWAATLTGVGYAASATARGRVSDALAVLAAVVVLTVAVRAWRRSRRVEGSDRAGDPGPHRRPVRAPGPVPAVAVTAGVGEGSTRPAALTQARPPRSVSRRSSRRGICLP